MSRLVNGSFCLALRGLSYLPFSFMYRISDGLTWLVYEKIGYRRQVVRENLEHSFPEKTSEELSKIERKFYHSLLDILFESIKLFSLKDDEIKKRFIVENAELLNDLYNEGRSVFMLGSHQFNWEWANHAIRMASPFRFLIVYLPLNNRLVDLVFEKIRTLRGQDLIVASQFKTVYPNYRTQKTMSIMLGDQNPGDPSKAFWIPFLGRESPFHGGLERLARRQPVAIVFAEAHKEARGHYRCHLRLICKDSTLTEPGEITHKFVQVLEGSIRKQPENWVWSHRRWRHQRPQIDEKTVT